MIYSISGINLDLLLSSRARYLQLTMDHKENVGRLTFQTIDEETMSFIKDMGIHHFETLDDLVQFPFLKIESDYYNWIPYGMPDDHFQFRTFEWQELPPYDENPYLKMMHKDSLIHVTTLQDSQFLIENNVKDSYCSLCARKQPNLIRIRDLSNEKDAFHICRTCWKKI